MNRKLISFTCLALTFSGIGLLIFKQFEWSAYVSAIAAISSILAIKKLTSVADTYMALISAVCLGLAIHPVFSDFPLYATALITITMTGFFRMTFGAKLGLFQKIWIESLFFGVGLVLYVAANLLYPEGWQGWALPAPIVAFYCFLAIAHTLDAKTANKAMGNARNFNVEIGDQAPDFSLPDQNGELVTLSDYGKSSKHVLLIFVRGDWCPSCHIMLRTYQRNKEKLGEKDITVMAIGPDPVGVNREMVESLNVDYKILSDDSLDCSRKYGIKKVPNNPSTSYEEGIPLPASFLIGKDGILHYTSRADHPGEILHPSDLFPVLESLN